MMNLSRGEPPPKMYRMEQKNLLGSTLLLTGSQENVLFRIVAAGSIVMARVLAARLQKLVLSGMSEVRQSLLHANVSSRRRRRRNNLIRFAAYYCLSSYWVFRKMFVTVKFGASSNGERSHPYITYGLSLANSLHVPKERVDLSVYYGLLEQLCKLINFWCLVGLFTKG